MRLPTLACLTVASIAMAAPAVAAPPTRVAPDSPGCVVRTAPPKVGLKETSRTSTDGRLLDLKLQSEATQNEQPVRVLLPKGYSASRRYPVLYLLHGAFGDQNGYTANGFEKVIADLPYIVVMPYDGPDGSYSDWYGTLAGTTDPIPSWETYHLRELVPFIDAHFRTQADAAHRFIAGISSGGAGTMKYAAANPGMFGAAGSLSGAVNTDYEYPNYPTISEALWGLTLVPGSGPDGHCTWGDPYTQHAVWLDNDPTYLAENLKGTPLWLSSGTGEPGPYDSQSYTDPVEYEIWGMNQEFAKTLDAAGIPHTDDFYGPGTHSNPYWLRELPKFLAWLKPRIGKPVPAPASFSLRSIRPSFSGWGWGFRASHDVREFVYLRDISSGGFAVTGSGALNAVTAPVYQSGRRYTIDVSDSVPVTETADSAGRLHLHVDMGPSHEVQQHDFGAGATKDWTHLEVRISRAGP